jgi:hypothetical protein
MDGERPDDEEQDRPRPRVVDKRARARPPADAPSSAPQAAPPEKSPIEAPPATAVGEPPPPVADEPPDAPPDAPPSGPEVWTPEQEEQARRVAEELARVPSKDLVVSFAMNFVEVASVKLETGDLAGAQMAIDAFDGIVKGVGPRLGDAEGPMRSVLAQLQMAYAQRATPPPQPR